VKLSDSVPDFQTLMLPVLQTAASGELSVSELTNKLAIQFGLTDEQRAELLPSGKQTKFANRAQWAKTYLTKAGLLQTTKRAHFIITDAGKNVLSENPEKIDIKFLTRFQEFNQFRFPQDLPKKPLAPQSDSDLTPDETMRAVHDAINAALADELLTKIRDAPPAFFEALTVKLVVAMGYGGSLEDAGRALGKSGDGGVDGVIDEDQLGLDRIYIQAKRYKENISVSAGDIRNFFGALDQQKALKGIFITTSTFSPSAVSTASGLSKRIVLIDGSRLARLMIKYDVGCRTTETMAIKRIDEEFFEI
jgi:restriction system protein